MGNVDVFRLPAKGLHFGQWNYLIKTKFEEVKVHM